MSDKYIACFFTNSLYKAPFGAFFMTYTSQILNKTLNMLLIIYR
jgi:hypothetical protein